MIFMADELKNLPPEERIKKLKELEKQRKKEIEEAQKKIKESEDELRERRKWKEKVPIPEFAQEGFGGLSEEAKDILKQHRGVKEKLPELSSGQKTKPSPVNGKEPASLEETLHQEQFTIPPEIVNTDYTRDLSREPVQNIYQGLVRLQREIEEKGYISGADERLAEYSMGAIERKRAEGYDFSEEGARIANLTQQIGASLRSMYKSGQRDVYQ